MVRICSGCVWPCCGGTITAVTFEAAVDYRSPVPLFGFGGEAADHGQAEVDCPGTDAVQAIDKISRRRSDLA